ncbi:WD40/YVTN/BNR-like repeat-containing protein [Spartinivicinus ruber]|uniref:WD40/YVTN/BNR-like repeat-containing protein n=1 Tax=Spartinivicinus ruber TaxID=2683272 RepID=UPI0013D14E46|nr:YCF48-related protein [Spartinivicinus ruber]
MRFAARQRRFARVNQWPALNALLKAGLLILLLTNTFKLYADNKITDPPAVASDKASQGLLLDITALPSSQRLVAVGERGHIVYSDDQGKNWQQAKVPTSQLITALHFVDQQQGWAVGHDSIILATNDGGATWQRQYDNLAVEAPLLDVWFINTQEGFVVGAYGQILRTTDGGNNWQDWSHTIENEEEFHYNSITAIDNDRLMIVGEAGLLYRSVNRGKNWELLESPYEGSLFGAVASGIPDGALIFGLRGHVFRTNDFGDTWQQVKVNTEQGLYGGQLLASQQITIVGNAGVVLVSKDAGVNFQVMQRADRKALSNVASLANQNLVLVGEGGVKLASPFGKPLVNKITE